MRTRSRLQSLYVTFHSAQFDKLRAVLLNQSSDLQHLQLSTQLSSSLLGIEIMYGSSMMAGLLNILIERCNVAARCLAQYCTVLYHVHGDSR